MNNLRDKTIALYILLIMAVVVVMYVVALGFLALATVSTVVAQTDVVETKQLEPVVLYFEEAIPAPKVIHNTPKPLDKETYLLAQLISAEAKGEPYEGMLAVGNVVMNRIGHKGFPDTLKGVIFQKGQFSPVANGSIYDKPTDKAIKAAKEVMSGKRVVDEGTLFFYNPTTSTSKWIFTRKVVDVIGRHAFAI